jgi:hypothetical protein
MQLKYIVGTSTIQHTILTPSARQSLLPKPHGKAQIFIHHGSRRPQPASQSAVAVMSTPGTSSGINTGGGATRQSQSRSRTRLCSYMSSSNKDQHAVTLFSSASDRHGSATSSSQQTRQLTALPVHCTCPTATAASTTSERHGAGQLPAYRNRSPNVPFQGHNSLPPEIHRGSESGPFKCTETKPKRPQ